MHGGAFVGDAPVILTVSSLTEMIRLRIESDKRLNVCHIVGEISNFKRHTSNHLYFTLKDDKSRIRAIMFAGKSRFLPFEPKDGMRVICRGSVSVFDRDGQYQIYIDEMQPDGVGALYVSFTQLREKLSLEGLFDEGRKRLLPRYPRIIGVVTSPTGAVIRDICSTLARRYPLASVILAPALVQGPGAATTIVAALESLFQPLPDGRCVDVIIVGRGGGSLEELWPFNEEAVARVVSSSPIPIISAVGHETDVTICDFVADVRAATPTAAAELAAPSIADIMRQLRDHVSRVESGLRWHIARQRQSLGAIESLPILRDPKRQLEIRRQVIDYLESALQANVSRPLRGAVRRLTDISERLQRQNVKRRISDARLRLFHYHQGAETSFGTTLNHLNRNLDRHITGLEALNPLKVLSRGYSVVYQEDGASVVSAVGQVKPGQRIVVRVADGNIDAKVMEGGMGYERGKQSKFDI